MPQPTFEIGERFTLSQEALDNYGQQYAGHVFIIRQYYDHESLTIESEDDPHGHFGFDSEGSGGTECLYSSTFPTDLYEFEMKHLGEING